MVKIIVSCILLCLIALPTNAQTEFFRIDTGSIKFVSEAPLETITAKSIQLEGIIEPSTNRLAFTIPIESFQGFNSPLQRVHFNENYMESDLFPNATFSGKIIEKVDFNTPGIYKVRVKGQLSIHGVIQNRIIEGEIKVNEGGIMIASRFSVPLNDHNIVIPKIVHQKIAPIIKVKVFAILN